MMQTYGISSLHDLFGDLVILRNLAPFDLRLPGLADAWQAMGLASPRIPRKHEPEYAKASVWFVRQARALDLPGADVRDLLFIGDTAMADGNAFRNLARAGGWPGWCFIGAEKLSAPASLTVEADNVSLANRWALRAGWLAAVKAAGARLDEHTAKRGSFCASSATEQLDLGARPSEVRRPVMVSTRTTCPTMIAMRGDSWVR